MGIEKHLRITGYSTVSWKDAIVQAVAEASKTIDYLSNVKIIEQRAKIDGKKLRPFFGLGYAFFSNDFEYENAIFDPSDPAFMTRETKLSFNGFTINPGMKYHLSDLLFIEGSYKYFAVNSSDIDGTANTHFINLGLGFKF